MLLHFFVDGFSCLVVVSVPVKIYISMGEFGGPQALPGGAQPYPNPLYGGEGLSLEKLEQTVFVAECIRKYVSVTLR
jgi:hypothetical protein